ncbi:MAG: energy transducer TonB [Nitrospirae bacterium]|nr:energy transducer TonB [Nitrospirota bacterium]
MTKNALITGEIIISTSLHILIVFLFIFFPPFFMQIKEPSITEVTLINALEPMPMPSIKEKMRSHAPVPPPVIQKTAPPVPKIKSIPQPEKAIADEPVKDIGRIGLPTRSDIGKKETASFSKKSLDHDIPLPNKPLMQEAKNIQPALPIAKKGETAGIEALGIKGTAGKRKLIDRPPPPTVDSSVTVTIELEFKILADGSVVDVVPVRKADIKLEEIAIRYLKKWRFNAASEEDRDEYVGIVPIKFKVR